MIKIEYDGEVLNVPSNMNEITLSQFQQISKLEFKDNKKYFIQILQIFNIPNIVINSLNIENYVIIKNALTVLFADIDRPLQNIIEFGGDKYQFTEKYDDIRMEQFVDLMEISKNKLEIIDNLHIISSLLYRKVIEEKKDNDNIIYTVEEYDSSVVLDRAILFKKVDLEVFLGVLGFFFHLKALSMKSISLISQQEQAK